MNTDGNTYAINRHLAEREECDLHQSMVDDIEALRDEVEALEAQRDELLEALQWYAEETNWEQTSAANDDPHDGRLRDLWNGDFSDGWAIARAAIAKAKDNT